MDTANPGSNRPEKLKWHPAFLQALQLELMEYKNFLQFKYEYQLTAEPLRVNLLIIKKPRDLAIDKNIARIFKSDNLVEFKSPEDYLSVKDFLKVYAYACLYVAITPETVLSDVTLTFVEHRHPRELIGYLTGERNYGVEETSPGVYTVSEDYLPIQLIETKRLSAEENLWLKSLTNDLEAGAARTILERKKKTARKAPLNAYLDVLLRANPRAFMEALNMANHRETFEEVFTEAGIIPQWIEQGEEKKALAIARNLLAKGWAVEEVAETTELPSEKVQSLIID
ncbi:MAG: hypothetical protein LBK63_04205 [Treponema sp.]|jgi:hypothetical protein|nr:hypothetical protein [Treponema sp.]